MRFYLTNKHIDDIPLIANLEPISVGERQSSIVPRQLGFLDSLDYGQNR